MSILTPTKQATSKLLRELTDDEFFERYHCSRFTAAVLAARFRYIIEHVCSRCIPYAFSHAIRESSDMSATVTGPPDTGFATAAVSQTITVFYGSMPEAVRIALEEFGVDRLVPGDVVMVNDSHRVGTHLNDVCFIRPVFVDGNLIGAMTIRAHMIDIGGSAVEISDVGTPDLYGAGLVIPPTLLYHAGQPVASTFNLLLDNTRRGPIILPDIQTINASLELGEELLVETVRKYGFDAYVGSIRYANDASAETMRLAVSRIPDGEYEGEAHLDSDGVSPDFQPQVRVRIAKRGERIEFDLSGSSPSNKSALNCAWLDAKSAAAIALKFLIDPRTPFTSGSMRDVDILLPPDTMINTSPPHNCQYYPMPVQLIIYATFKALNPILGAGAIGGEGGIGSMMHVAFGVSPEGRPWYGLGGAPNPPWGATKAGDGDSAQYVSIANMTDGGCEPTEAESPVILLRREYVADTGGPGFNRGGCGTMVDSFWPLAAQHKLFGPLTVSQAPVGVNGGHDGTLPSGWLWDPANATLDADFLPHVLPAETLAAATPVYGKLDPVTHQLDPNGTDHVGATVTASAGSTFRLACSGAGGWGDPRERDPERVLADVRNEYVSIEGAARDYGVVVVGDPCKDPEGLRLDVAATKQLRDHH